MSVIFLFRFVVLSLHQMTPLHVAAGSARFKIVEYLVDEAANISTKDSDGVSIYFWMNFFLIDPLLKYGVYIYIYIYSQKLGIKYTRKSVNFRKSEIHTGTENIKYTTLHPLIMNTGLASCLRRGEASSIEWLKHLLPVHIIFDQPQFWAIVIWFLQGHLLFGVRNKTCSEHQKMSSVPLHWVSCLENKVIWV